MASGVRVERVFDVQCVLCGRVAGQVVDGVFLRDWRVQAPVVKASVSPRCGECGGSLLFEGVQGSARESVRYLHRSRRAVREREQVAASAA